MNGPREAETGWRLRLGWGIGSLGASALLNGVTFLALFYLTRVLGLPPALAGVLLFVTKLYSIVTDPVMGLLSDRVRNPARRRRPFLLAGAVVSGLAFLALFNAPAWAPAAIALWCGGALLLYATGFTLFTVPYLAMPAEMTDSYHERSRLMSVRVAFAALGILAGYAIAPALIGLFGGGRGGYASMAMVLAALITVTMGAAYFGTRGARTPAADTAAASAASRLAGALRSAPFAWLISSKFAHLFGVAVSNSSLLFVITAVLDRPESEASLFGLAATTGAVASLPLWLRCARRMGKRWSYMAAVAVYVPVILTWLLASPAEPQWLLALRGFAIGLATGGLTLTAQAMLPDTMAHDLQLTGLHREGTFAAIYSAVEKAAAALGPLAFSLVLSSGAGAFSETERSNVQLAAALIPAAASIASALILLGYRLDDRYRPQAAAQAPG